MYKLVVVAGELRGTEYILEPGSNIIGRAGGSSIEIDVPGVSSEHFSITVHDDSVFLKDLGSANGTLVNNKQIKSSTLVTGDKVIIPNIIMQLVHVKEKKIYIKAEEDEEKTLDSVTAPDDVGGKILHYFKYRPMSLLYGVNKELEWHSLLSISLAVFMAITVGMIVMPVLQDNTALLLEEVATRGIHYTKDIARENKVVLEERKLDQVNVRFLEDEEGIISYELFDKKGRIVRPISQLNTYISDSFSLRVAAWAKSTKGKRGLPIIRSLSDGSIGIGRVIKAYSPKTASVEIVGIVAIKFKPKTLVKGTNNSSQAYLESLVIGIIIAIVFLGVAYYLTLRPVEEMIFQLEEIQKGKRGLIETEYLMKELNPLKNGINNVVQRLRESQPSEGEDFGEVEEDTSYVMSLGQFLEGSGDPVMILNSEKLIQRINNLGEDIVGIRENASEGQNLLDAAREKGFAATVNELCDMSANNGGTCQTGQYELGGNDYTVNVVSLIGKDGFAKAFYVTFIKD